MALPKVDLSTLNLALPNCQGTSPGVARVALIPCDDVDVTGITVDPDNYCITALPTASTPVVLEFDEDSASFEQTGEKVGTCGTRYTRNLTFTRPGLDCDNKAVMAGLVGQCCLIYVIEYVSGDYDVIGIDLNMALDPPVAKNTRVKFESSTATAGTSDSTDTCPGITLSVQDRGCWYAPGIDPALGITLFS